MLTLAPAQLRASRMQARSALHARDDEDGAATLPADDDRALTVPADDDDGDDGALTTPADDGDGDGALTTPADDGDGDGAQTTPADDDGDDEPQTVIANCDPLGEVRGSDGGTVIECDTDARTVQACEDATLFEIRSKLKFVGNDVRLRNPETVPSLLEDIKSAQEGFKETVPDAKFIFCLHVGTTASDRLKTKRPGFMEGRVKSVKAAFDGKLDGEIVDTFEHFKSTRFAGFVMKGFCGESPGCAADEVALPPK